MDYNFKEGLRLENFKSKEKKSKLYEIDDKEERKKKEREDKICAYKQFCDRQGDTFKKYLDFVNKILCSLKHYTIVSSATYFTARIKSIDSALVNDERDKTLNDVFGIAINAATGGESEFLCLLLSSGLQRTKESIKNKENGYEAHHYSGYPKTASLSQKIKEVFETKYDGEKMYEEYMDSLSDYETEKNSKTEIATKNYFIKYYDKLNKYLTQKKKIVKGQKLKDLEEEIKAIEEEYNIILKEKFWYQPIVEIQFKTVAVSIEAAEGTADHGSYKRIKIEEIQKEYDRYGKIQNGEYKLPIKMYESRLQCDEYGNPLAVREIEDEDEKASAMYPFLIVKRKGEKER